MKEYTWIGVDLHYTDYCSLSFANFKISLFFRLSFIQIVKKVLVELNILIKGSGSDTDRGKDDN